MTFFNAPLAIDGAVTSSALIRRGEYAALSAAEGVVNATDLKVTQLAVPGNGLLISSGNAVITNRYQTDPNETYVVANAGTHEVLSTEMPTSQPTDKSYLVLVTVGDPEFSQVGHPWMTSDVLDPTEAADYVYVRPWILEVAPGTSSFASLGLDYPAYALARIDIPASTTTITNSMITDLRDLASPRSKLEIVQATGVATTLTSVNPTYQRFPNVAAGSIKIPDWATTAKITGFVEGVRLTSSALAILRPYIEGTTLVGFQTNAYESATVTNGARRTYSVGGKIDVTSVAGQTKNFSVQAAAYDAGNASKVLTDTATTVVLQVYFEEAAI